MKIENKNGWGIILVAGASSRFGSAKALAPWGSGTLLSAALNTAEKVFGNNFLCVTGGHAQQIQNHLSGIQFVFNRNWEGGLGTSISAGIREVLKKDPKTPLITVIPVDQPFVTETHLENLVKKAQETGRCILSQDDNAFGPPATIPSHFFLQLTNLSGEKGVKSNLLSSDIETLFDKNVLLDIDTQEDLKKLASI